MTNATDSPACLLPDAVPLPTAGALPHEPPAAPVSGKPRSPLRWFGGKFYQAGRLVRLFPEHTTYCEVFAGACHVLFRKEPSPVEAVNDTNEELTNFFRVLQEPAGLAYLAARHQWALYSRSEFERRKRQDPAALTEHERAWRFLYLNRCCFSGRGMGMDSGTPPPAFGITVSAPEAHSSNLAKSFAGLMPRLRAAHARLAAVQIECLDYANFIALYDRPHTFFYLDPPYYGYEDTYGRTFARAEYERLARLLAEIRGRFLLSISDCAEARRTFSRFNLIAEPKVTYFANRDGSVRAGELCYANYDLTECARPARRKKQPA